MVDIIKGSSKQPLLACWISVMWEPFMDNREMVKKGMEDINDLGFNTFYVDSFGEDFFDRYAGIKCSSYVAMHEYMQKIGKKIGLKFSCLSLWVHGDNAYYMGIREFPPRIGEAITFSPSRKEILRKSGEHEEEWYKLWSEKTQEVMVDHQQGLISIYKDKFAHVEYNGQKIPFFFSYFDPAVYASFDKEGITRYQQWLRKRYRQIDIFNEVYRTSYSMFEEIPPSDYWYGYNTGQAEFMIEQEDFDDQISIRKWIDNQLWRKDELTNYFKVMDDRYNERGLNLFLVPSLQQWKIFFNDAKFPSWWTTIRALDPWEISKYCKEVSFITAPVDCYSRPDVYVISAERSLARSMNNGRSSLGGFYVGRYLLEDIYAHISPCEVIATMLTTATDSLFCYGYNGMDDGGTLFKMDWRVRESLKSGLAWFKKVAPLLKDKSRRKDIAILFPLAMSLIEPINEGTDFPSHRMDTLGWYKMLVDMHYMVDFLHPDQIKEGNLEDYFVLVMPCDNGYKYMPDKVMEEKVVAWVRKGGILLHGPCCQSLSEILRPTEKKYRQECINWEENIMPESFLYTTFSGIDSIATYESGDIAIGKKEYGKGKVYSFGFHLGDAYTRPTMKRVDKGVKDSYPIYLLKNNPVYSILKEYKEPKYLRGLSHRGIEIGDFGDILVLVNHSTTPWKIILSSFKEMIFQYPSHKKFLQPHSGVLVILGSRKERRDYV